MTSDDKGWQTMTRDDQRWQGIRDGKWWDVMTRDNRMKSDGKWWKVITRVDRGWRGMTSDDKGWQGMTRDVTRIEAFVVKWMWTELFWVITQRVLVTPCRRFGTTYRSYLQESSLFCTVEYRTDMLPPWPLKIGPTDCRETSVRNYHYSSRNNP
jgi:hypothetical protein